MLEVRGLRAGLLAAALAGVAMSSASDATAGVPSFGRFDIPTVFYVSKSDDHNRVDYAIRLDEHCVPTSNDAVFFYWREFEKAPPVVIHNPGMLDFVGYGISEQRTVFKAANVGVYALRLRQLPKLVIQIITTQRADGRCSAQARSTINGKDSELSYAFVQLDKGGFSLTPSVAYVDLHGKDLENGQEVVERLHH